ncbi:phage GP46 family protein [Mesorhizobium sp. 1M-11]|uniref:phage GP46 family protein n=1 Tax=Mesorhizobium sp. 1M-11 TaxID=1529006 RepID=UPI0006C73D0A|nr:phage GP46 family protein [Mesorhizobium sp. 1M-11]
MFFDLALVYDPAARRCDLTIGDDGDLAIDDTSITPVLLSIGLDRRAAPDDPLPQGRTAFLTETFSERRGWAGDGLDGRGERSGSRLWLLDRAKQTEVTRLLFRFWLEEALAWAARETGQPADIEVAWVRPQTLGYRVLVDDAALSVAGGA